MEAIRPLYWQQKYDRSSQNTAKTIQTHKRRTISVMEKNSNLNQNLTPFSAKRYSAK